MNSPPALSKPGSGAKGPPARFTARNWHKWAGVFGLLWLSTMGVTGWLINHREDWDWLWQHGVPVAMLPKSSAVSAEVGLARLLQINPSNSHTEIAAGARGAWWSVDGGTTWAAAATGTTLPLIITAMEPSPDWDRVWFATNDGIWVSTDAAHSLRPFCLSGVRISSLAQGASDSELVGVAERSRIFRLRINSAGPPVISWLSVSPPGDSALLPGTSLNRLTLDLHYGRGIFPPPWGERLQDVLGLGLAFLGLTGAALWILPQVWRRKRMTGNRLPPARARRAIFVWLIRIHGKWLGPVIALPLALIFATGPYIGHYAVLSPLFKATPVSISALPPTYHLGTLRNWIECIAAYPGKPTCLSIGTRTGLFTSDNNGRTWRQEADVNGGVYHLRRIDNQLIAANGMSGTTQRLTRGGWRAVAPGSHIAMASEVTSNGHGGLLWKHGSMLHISDGDGREVEAHAFKGPHAQFVPFYTVAASIHTGSIFWAHWRWCNDLFAVTGLVLLGTGLVRWWRLVRPGG